MSQKTQHTRFEDKSRKICRPAVKYVMFLPLQYISCYNVVMFPLLCSIVSPPSVFLPLLCSMYCFSHYSISFFLETHLNQSPEGSPKWGNPEVGRGVNCKSQSRVHSCPIYTVNLKGDYDFPFLHHIPWNLRQECFLWDVPSKGRVGWVCHRPDITNMDTRHLQPAI